MRVAEESFTVPLIHSGRVPLSKFDMVLFFPLAAGLFHVTYF